MRAEVGEQRDGALDRGRDLRVDDGAAVRRAVGDAQTGDAVLDRAEPRPVVALRRVDLARIRHGDGRHQVRAVADGAGDRPDVAEQPGAARRVERHERVRGLEAERAAEGRRHPDRAAAVAADVERRHPGDGRDRGTAGRAAGRARRVPRVAGVAGERAVAQALPAQLRRRGLAQQRRARLEQPRHDGGVLRVGLVARGERPLARRPAGDQREVLDRGGDPVERAPLLARRPPALARAGRVQRPIRVDEHEGVQRRVERGDRVQVRLRHLDRGGRALGVRRAQLVDAREGGLVHGCSRGCAGAGAPGEADHGVSLGAARLAGTSRGAPGAGPMPTGCER